MNRAAHTTRLQGALSRPSKAQEDRAAKAELCGLPGFLFGLWIK